MLNVPKLTILPGPCLTPLPLPGMPLHTPLHMDAHPLPLQNILSVFDCPPIVPARQPSSLPLRPCYHCSVLLVSAPVPPFDIHYLPSSPNQTLAIGYIKYCLKPGQVEKCQMLLVLLGTGPPSDPIGFSYQNMYRIGIIYTKFQ